MFLYISRWEDYSERFLFGVVYVKMFMIFYKNVVSCTMFIFKDMCCKGMGHYELCLCEVVQE